MRPPLDKPRLLRFLEEFGKDIAGNGVIYLTGGATALLHGWREMTIDVDLKADPEPEGFFESIARLKDSFPINIELAAPDQFVPTLPGWKERSIFIARHGGVDFYHYDPYGQALAKLDRRHARDLSDVESMHEAGLVKPRTLRDLFGQIEAELIRFPAIEITTLTSTINQWCLDHS